MIRRGKSSCIAYDDVRKGSYNGVDLQSKICDGARMS